MAKLVVVSGPEKGTEYVLEAAHTIGRLANNDICVHDQKMSRSNSRVFAEGGRYLVEDLGSSNGTYLNEERIERAPLSDNDEIRVGETYFVFLAEGADVAPSAKASSSPTSTSASSSSSRDERSLSSSDIEFASPSTRDKKVQAVGDRVLTYSKHAKKEAGSTSWAAQDLAQRPTWFRALITLVALAVAAGLFWGVMKVVASG